MKTSRSRWVRWIVLVLFAGFSLGVYVENYHIHSSGTIGRYDWSRVVLWPEKMNGYAEYMYTAVHEYSHYLYDKKLNASQKAEWKGIVDEFGFHSGYPRVERSWFKYDEELAECVAQYMIKSGQCEPEQEEFIWRNVYLPYLS